MTEKLVAGPLRGVREVLRDWKHETFTRWKDGIDVEVCTARCKKCQIEAALASPVQGVQAPNLAGNDDGKSNYRPEWSV